MIGSFFSVFFSSSTNQIVAKIARFREFGFSIFFFFLVLVFLNMASVSQNPYTSYKDCSQGICSIYCPQWCNFIFPPPHPSTIGDDDGSDTTDFSPLIIAVIGILSSAFILISYYIIISKYSRRRGSGSSAGGQNSRELNDGNREQTPFPNSGTGLDETLIKSVTVCKYKKDGFIEGTDCSVCLSEFEEDESLRLLPKCSHAFHLPCIDTWLKAHASCPLCRANIAPSNIFTAQELAPPSQETNVSAAREYQHRIDDAALVIQDLDGSVRQEEVVVVSLAAGDGDDHVPQKDIIEAQDHPIQPIRRSVSLNVPVCETQVSISIADILCNSDEEEQEDDEQARDKGKRKVGS